MSLEREIEAIVRRVLAERPAGAQHVSVAEYARRYSISPSTVRAAIRSGRLPSVRIGRAVRIAADAVIGSSTPDSATSRARLRLLAGAKR